MRKNMLHVPMRLIICAVVCVSVPLSDGVCIFRGTTQGSVEGGDGGAAAGRGCCGNPSVLRLFLPALPSCFLSPGWQHGFLAMS